MRALITRIRGTNALHIDAASQRPKGAEHPADSKKTSTPPRYAARHRAYPRARTRSQKSFGGLETEKFLKNQSLTRRGDGRRFFRVFSERPCPQSASPYGRISIAECSACASCTSRAQRRVAQSSRAPDVSRALERSSFTARVEDTTNGRRAERFAFRTPPALRHCCLNILLRMRQLP